MTHSIQIKLVDMGYNLDAISDGMAETFRIALAGVARGALNEWVRIAQSRLHTTRETYIDGLRQAESFVAAGDSFSISLVGRMPNNIEFGMAGFDMKTVRPGWLGGAKSKVSKSGSRYVVIPFRHSTGGGPRMNYTGKAAAVGDLKTQLRDTVKKYGIDRMVRAATGQVVAGPVSRVPKSAAVHPYLKGLTRIQKPTEGKTKSGMGKGSSQLMTFRIMSEKSNPESWIHPGIKAASILPEVERWVDSQLDKIIGDLLWV